ncbi:MAG: hypothetical protein COB15_17110 [Flavobacteriales bacterium]|nr:MAG: hypothetical protein COB15_17110 [Flavobacteriales bacterium]
MKYLKTYSIILILTVALNGEVFAQSNSIHIDQRIINVYGETYANNLKNKAPERILYLNYFLDHSYEIREVTYHNDEKTPKLSSVSLNTKYTGEITRPTFNVNSFNPLLYNFKRDRIRKTQYRVDNTNKIIVFYSEQEIAKAFNQSKQN